MRSSAAFPKARAARMAWCAPFKAGALQVALEDSVQLPVTMRARCCRRRPLQPGTSAVRFGSTNRHCGLHTNEKNALTHRSRANRNVAWHCCAKPDMSLPTVLVLGGYGQFGRRIVKALQCVSQALKQVGPVRCIVGPMARATLESRNDRYHARDFDEALRRVRPDIGRPHGRDRSRRRRIRRHARDAGLGAHYADLADEQCVRRRLRCAGARWPSVTLVGDAQ